MTEHPIWLHDDSGQRGQVKSSALATLSLPRTSDEQRTMWVLDGAVQVSEEPVREDKYTLSLSAGQATV